MSYNIEAAMPISIADIQAHPAEAMAALIEEVQRQEKEISSLWDNFGIAMGLIKQLKTRNAKTKEAGKKTSARLAAVENLLVMNGNEPLTFAQIGRMLELGSRDGKKTTRKQNMTILGRILAADPRFAVFESNTQKGRKMVRLDDGYFDGKER